MSSIDERGQESRMVGQERPRVEPDSTTPLLHRQPTPRRPESSSNRRSFIYRLLAPLFLVAVLISIFHSHLPWSTSPHPPKDDLASSLEPDSVISNGTHAFRRTVILISLDGAKPNYLDPTLAPHLSTLGTSTPTSRRAEYLQPIFPTLTFPNHWALLTGLYAGSHGIVANDFAKASTGEQFYYTSPAHSWNGSWWLGEPIWATAQRAGLNSAVLMWPGPPETSAGARARYFQKYESNWALDQRLDKVLEWVDIGTIEERPSLICAYVPDIDQAAHKFGPESKQVMAVLKRVDGFIGQLHKELVEKRGLGEIVDVVIVSDHGMTKTSNEKLIFLDELLGSELYSKIEHRDGWPSAGLRFKGRNRAEQDKVAKKVYDKLSKAKGNKSERWSEGWDVYWREDLPESYHLSSPPVEDRLAPLWMIPKLGWSITSHPEMATFTDGVYAPVGNHGYDNEEPEMRAIFVASGPSFAKIEGNRGKEWNMDGFRNVEVHNLVSRILGVPESKRAPTNGTWTFWDSHLKAGYSIHTIDHRVIIGQ